MGDRSEQTAAGRQEWGFDERGQADGPIRSQRQKAWAANGRKQRRMRRWEIGRGGEGRPWLWNFKDLAAANRVVDIRVE